MLRINQSIVRRPLKWLSRDSTVRGSLLALFDQGVSSFTSFLTGVIVARACAIEEFGLFTLGFTIFQFAASLQAALIHVPYVVYSPRLEGNEHCHYRGSVLIHQLVISGLVFAALRVASTIMSGTGIGKDLAAVLIALSVVAPAMLLREFARCVCFAELKMKTSVILDGSVFVLQIPTLFLLARFQFLSAGSAYLVIGGACMAVTGVWFFLERKQFSFRIAGWIADFRTNWTTGKWVLASSVVWVLAMYLYPWLLTAFHGTAAAGVWAACFGVVSSFNPIVLGLQNYVGPRISHVYSKRGVRGMQIFLVKTLIGVGVLIVPFCLAISAFGGRLLSFIYGIKYERYGMVVSVLSFNILFSALTVILSRVFFVLGKGKIDLLINVFSLVLLLSLGLWLTWSFGTLGAAVGLLLGGFGGFGLRSFAYMRLVPRIGVQAG